jgi:hypothetical protein
MGNSLHPSRSLVVKQINHERTKKKLKDCLGEKPIDEEQGESNSGALKCQFSPIGAREP